MRFILFSILSLFFYLQPIEARPPTRVELATQLGISQDILKSAPDLEKFLIANAIYQTFKSNGDQILVGRYGVLWLVLNGKTYSWQELKKTLPVDWKTGKLQGYTYTKAGFVPAPPPAIPPTPPIIQEPEPPQPPPEPPPAIPDKPPVVEEPAPPPVPPVPPVIEEPEIPLPPPPSPEEVEPQSPSLPSFPPPNLYENLSFSLTPYDCVQANATDPSCTTWLHTQELPFTKIDPSSRKTLHQGSAFEILRLAPPSDALLTLIRENQLAYAKKQQYSFHEYDLSHLKQNSSGLFNILASIGLVDIIRPAVWNKVLAIANQLQRMPEDSWLLWLDPDIILTDPSMRLEELIHHVSRPGEPLPDILVSKPHYWEEGEKALNTDVMLIRNTPWSRRFFQLIWNQNTSPSPDSAINTLWKRLGLGNGHFVRIDSKYLNQSYDYPYLDKNNLMQNVEIHDVLPSRWQPGDFMAYVRKMGPELNKQLGLYLLQFCVGQPCAGFQPQKFPFTEEEEEQQRALKVHMQFAKESELIQKLEARFPPHSSSHSIEKPQLLETIPPQEEGVTLLTSASSEAIQQAQRAYALKQGEAYFVYEAGSNQIALLLSHLKELPPNHWLIWLGPSMVVTNTNLSWRPLIFDFGHYDEIQRDIIVTKDPNAFLNDGVIIVRNTAWAQVFLQTVLSLMETKNLNAQQAMVLVAKAIAPYDGRLLRINQRFMNGFYRADHSSQLQPDESKWQPGDFLAQVVEEDEGRAALMTQYLLEEAVDRNLDPKKVKDWKAQSNSIPSSRKEK